MRTDVVMYSGPDRGAGVPSAEALDEAYARGFDIGATAERERLFTALGASGINGCPWRMLAILDLAGEEPAMPALALASMVIANVAGLRGRS